MNNDYLDNLGSLALATRLKNLGERLAREVAQVYKESAFDFEPRWFTMVYALKDGDELAVTELSAMLNQTHPAVNQVANVLVEKGLISERKDESDQRKRLLKLSDAGRQLVSRMNTLWGRIKAANDELLQESEGGLLSALQKVEQSLDKKSMLERIHSRT